MTYCEEVGLKVGDKIRYIGDHKDKYYKGEKHHYWSPGDILTLEEDDNTPTPVFSGNGISSEYFGLKDREWEKVVEEIPTDTTASSVTKDTIVNVELTLWELFVIHNLLGLTAGEMCLYYLFEKVGESLPLNDAEDTYDDCSPVISWDMKGFNQWVDSHFMSPNKAQALLLRKQAEELIKQAEELEGK